MEQLPSLQLENYEGPLDLLLDLIRKQELNIFDIPIARVTRQYTEFLERRESLNLEIAADYIHLAATLVHIKSRMLLPQDPSLPEESDEEDPRTDLVQRLLEHEKFKSAAQMLREKQLVEQVTWTRPDLGVFDGEEGELAVKRDEVKPRLNGQHMSFLEHTCGA